jgi:uncharacterized protein YqjF (DUF2071 family)
MHQAWHELLFMHWRIPPDVLRARVPSALPLDTFDGDAWLAIVPFEMRDVRPRFLPAVPGLSFFPELNVRTYVTLNNRPGVYFFSLDAANHVAVALARRFFHLPYQNARMSCRAEGKRLHYASARTEKDALPASFRATYRPTAAPFVAAQDSLEYFLTARYCLYTLDPQGEILRGEIHHAPWQLQPAECEIHENTMTAQIQLDLPQEPPHLLFVKSINMVAWMPVAER